MLVGLAAAVVSMAGCGEPVPRPLLVFAAASLEDCDRSRSPRPTPRAPAPASPSTPRAPTCWRSRSRPGAPADVFVSADARWIDDLVADGLLDPASRRELLTNRLVVIAHPARAHAAEPLGDRHAAVSPSLDRRPRLGAGRALRAVAARAHTATVGHGVGRGGGASGPGSRRARGVGAGGRRA